MLRILNTHTESVTMINQPYLGGIRLTAPN